MKKDTSSPSTATALARLPAASTDAHTVPQVTAMTTDDHSLARVQTSARTREEVKDMRHDTGVDQRSS